MLLVVLKARALNSTVGDLMKWACYGLSKVLDRRTIQMSPITIQLPLISEN
jgi:hypothetical protein